MFIVVYTVISVYYVFLRKVVKWV